MKGSILHICLICVEIFAWGKYGGFGKATRILGRELSKRGIKVTAIVPRRAGQQPEEWLDGIHVLSFKSYDFQEAYRLYKLVDADIYHSQEPSTGTYLAKIAKPERKHVVTFRDPRNLGDWFTELRYPSLHKIQVLINWLYEDNWLVHQAVCKTDARFVSARSLIPKVIRKYHLKSEPLFIPTPTIIPETIQKSNTPVVCMVSRWDKRKRPEIFFELARAFPKIHFVAVGLSRKASQEKNLRKNYAHIPNLEMRGFINQFENQELSEIYSKSWILVNTAAREGLPNAFIEATAHGCAILSQVNPDNFTENFGYLVKDNNYAKGLAYLLENNNWKQKGTNGRVFVQNTFTTEQSLQQHIAHYHVLLNE